MAQVIQVLDIGKLFQMDSCVSLKPSPHLLLLLRASLLAPGSSHIFLTQPKIQPFLQGALVSFYWWIAFRNQDLGSRCAHCQWSVTASRPSL